MLVTSRLQIVALNSHWLLSSIKNGPNRQPTSVLNLLATMLMTRRFGLLPLCNHNLIMALRVELMALMLNWKTPINGREDDLKLRHSKSPLVLPLRHSKHTIKKWWCDDNLFSQRNVPLVLFILLTIFPINTPNFHVFSSKIMMKQESHAVQNQENWWDWPYSTIVSNTKN